MTLPRNGSYAFIRWRNSIPRLDCHHIVLQSSPELSMYLFSCLRSPESISEEAGKLLRLIEYCNFGGHIPVVV